VAERLHSSSHHTRTSPRLLVLSWLPPSLNLLTTLTQAPDEWSSDGISAAGLMIPLPPELPPLFRPIGSSCGSSSAAKAQNDRYGYSPPYLSDPTTSFPLSPPLLLKTAAVPEGLSYPICPCNMPMLRHLFSFRPPFSRTLELPGFPIWKSPVFSNRRITVSDWLNQLISDVFPICQLVLSSSPPPRSLICFSSAKSALGLKFPSPPVTKETQPYV